MSRILKCSLVIVALATSGCSTFNVQSKQAPNTDDYVKHTRIAWLWGLYDPIDNVECNGAGLRVVSMETNLLYEICSVVTLGAIVPMDIEYRCAGTEMKEGDPIGELVDSTQSIGVRP